jgi:hypothetical protein
VEFSLKEIASLSGTGCVIYSIVEDKEKDSLFDMFLQENYPTNKKEVDGILDKLEAIGDIGAKEHYFRQNEGKPGDGVCAIDDSSSRKKILRLYCIRYGSVLLILGGGGPKKVRRWQDDSVLKKQVEKLISYSKKIDELKKEQSEELSWNDDKTRFVGTIVK